MMSAMTIADLGLSQELDREALATIFGGAGWEFVSSSISSGPWSAYYGGTVISSKYNAQGQLVKQKWRWLRQRTQTETSYWNYYYF